MHITENAKQREFMQCSSHYVPTGDVDVLYSESETIFNQTFNIHKIYLTVIAIKNTKTAKKLLEISDQKLLHKRILLSKNET